MWMSLAPRRAWLLADRPAALAEGITRTTTARHLACLLLLGETQTGSNRCFLLGSGGSPLKDAWTSRGFVPTEIEEQA